MSDAVPPSWASAMSSTTFAIRCVSSTLASEDETGKCAANTIGQGSSNTPPCEVKCPQTEEASVSKAETVYTLRYTNGYVLAFFTGESVSTEVVEIRWVLPRQQESRTAQLPKA